LSKKQIATAEKLAAGQAAREFRRDALMLISGGTIQRQYESS